MLNVSVTGRDLAAASAYEAIGRIDWPEGLSRRDIAWRALKRGWGLSSRRLPEVRSCGPIGHSARRRRGWRCAWTRPRIISPTVLRVEASLRLVRACGGVF